MKNIFKKFFLLFVLLIAASFIASAQSISPAEKVSVTKQEAAQQTPAAAEKFFNITSLDAQRNVVETARANYKQAPADKAEALHHEYRMAVRLYTVELEKQLSGSDGASETAEKIRAELKKISTTD